MEFLGRNDAPFDGNFWQELDEVVRETAAATLIGRKFLPFTAGLGTGAYMVATDSYGKKEEVMEDGIIKFSNRTIHQIPELYHDFWLYWRDIEARPNNIDLSPAIDAVQKLCVCEDRMIFYGIEGMGISGLMNVKGAIELKKKDWNEGEHAYEDISAGVLKLVNAGFTQKFRLVMGVDAYRRILRLQPGTGVLESERIEKLLGFKILVSPVLEKNTALLVSASRQYMDFGTGQDIITAYIEAAEMNHHFRILETAFLRIKAPEAIIIYK